MSVTVDQSLSTLLAAAIGASAGIFGGVALDGAKRRRDGQNVAMTICGAIETELWMVEKRGHITFFKGILPSIKEGTRYDFFGFAPKDGLRNQIIDSNLDNIGFLSGELPAHVIRFTQMMWGIRVDLSRLVAGEIGKDAKTQAEVIEQDLAIVEEMMIFGADLARRLRRSAGQ